MLTSLSLMNWSGFRDAWFHRLGLLMADAEVLVRQCDIFVRGHALRALGFFYYEVYGQQLHHLTLLQSLELLSRRI